MTLISANIKIFVRTNNKCIEWENYFEKEVFNLGLKCLIWIFLSWNLKITYSYLKSLPLNLSNHKLWCKIKNSHIWDQNFLIWVFLGWIFKKVLSRFKSTLEFFYRQGFVQKGKFLNVGVNMDIFGLEFEKVIVLFEINAFEFG